MKGLGKLEYVEPFKKGERPFETIEGVPCHPFQKDGHKLSDPSERIVIWIDGTEDKLVKRLKKFGVIPEKGQTGRKQRNRHLPDGNYSASDSSESDEEWDKINSTNTRINCPCGRSTKQATCEENYWCSVCYKMHPKGTLMFACRKCDWDKCLDCDNLDAEQYYIYQQNAKFIRFPNTCQECTRTVNRDSCEKCAKARWVEANRLIVKFHEVIQEFKKRTKKIMRKCSKSRRKGMRSSYTLNMEKLQVPGVTPSNVKAKLCAKCRSSVDKKVDNFV